MIREELNVVRLLRYMLRQAIEDLCSPSSDEAYDAAEYILAVDNEYVLSFDNVCFMLGINPDYLRQIYAEPLRLAIEGKSKDWINILRERIFSYLIKNKNKLHSVIGISKEIKSSPIMVRIVTSRYNEDDYMGYKFVRLRYSNELLSHSVILIGLFDPDSSAFLRYKETGKIELSDIHMPNRIRYNDIGEVLNGEE